MINDNIIIINNNKVLLLFGLLQKKNIMWLGHNKSVCKNTTFPDGGLLETKKNINHAHEYYNNAYTFLFVWIIFDYNSHL